MGKDKNAGLPAAGANVDFNRLFDQQQQARQNNTGGMAGDMANYLDGQMLGAYGDFGNQMNGVMGMFNNIAGLNSANNQALNNVNEQYAAQYQSPVDQARLQAEGALNLARTNTQGALDLEHLRQEGQNQRFSQLSPLLGSLFGGTGIGGGAAAGGAAAGSAPSGMTGFNAVGPDGQKFAGASLGTGGGSTGGQVGATQPGNASTAQPTNVKAYTAPAKSPMVPPANVPTGYYDGLAGGYGQRLSPADTLAALARFKATGHYSESPYAPQGAGRLV